MVAWFAIKAWYLLCVTAARAALESALAMTVDPSCWLMVRLVSAGLMWN
jgi:hypothetical protein